MSDKGDLTAEEAAKALNIRPATLYAYVSRGLIRSEAAGPKGRGRLYHRDDVGRLRARQAQRRNPERAAEQALSWGLPILESALTRIADGRLSYRGQDALALAEASTFEQVAELLWTDEPPTRAPGLGDAIAAGYTAFDELRPWMGPLAGMAPADAFQVVLPLAAGRDAAGYDLRPHAVALTGARILGLLTAAATYPAAPASGRMAERLAVGWGLKGERKTRLIEAALILCADHELNTSAFTARCVASVRGTPYQVVMAALAALHGLRHGGYTERVEALFEEVGAAARAQSVLAAWLKRGTGLPGFGHKLYPEGDPRARLLLEMASTLAPRSPAWAMAGTITQAVARLTGERPTIDFALVVVTRVLRLPRGSPLALFALGRTAGWIAHAMEQYQTEAMIRPRARYVGK